MIVPGLEKLDELPGLLPHHLKHLRESGLSDATITAAGIRSETSPDALAACLNWRKPNKKMAPAIVWPYIGADGSNGYYRVRPDTPRTVKGDPVKYESPREMPNRVYYPPGVAELLQDAQAELLVTEGEKKALKAKQEGFACLGLPGVFAWKDKRREALLPELQRVNWVGRLVYIAFDSDLSRKPDVELAETRLAKLLTDCGAVVRCLRIPDSAASTPENPVKQGLDDFLVANGPGELRKLIDGAIEPEPPAGADGKEQASELEPAMQAKAFLAAREQDGLPRLRYWRGAWYMWRRGRYAEIQQSEVQADLILDINREFAFLTTSIVANVVQQVKAQSAIWSHVEPPAWMGDPPHNWPVDEILPLASSLVHIPSVVSGAPEYSVKATPGFFTLSALNYEFKIDAPRPALWLEFLNQLFGADPESAETLQDWFGYCLTPDTRQQKMLTLIGPPRSGKGTIARVLQALIGPENVAGPTLASFEKNFGLQPLLGKSLAIIPDARLGGQVNQIPIVERLLSITGEDSMTIDRKHREPVTGKLSTRVMLISNELPRLAESSGALANRMIVLRLTEDFLGKEDPTLTTKLLAELPGILLWAIAGWKRLRERGRFIQPNTGKELVDDLKDLCSPVGMFLRERCMLGTVYSAAIDDVYLAWADWCKVNGREHVGTKQSFGRDLKAAATRVKVAQQREGEYRIRKYEGLGLIGQE